MPLWDLVSFAWHYLRSTSFFGGYEPLWFYSRVGDALFACYLAFAIRGFLQWQRPWRTALGSICAWLILSVASILADRLWIMLLVVVLHCGALVYLLIADIARDRANSVLQHRHPGAAGKNACAAAWDAGGTAPLSFGHM